MSPPVREIGPIALMLSGFLLWSLAFLGIYGVQATGCSLGWNGTPLLGPLTVQRSVLLGLYALVLAGHALIVVRIDARPTDKEGDAEANDFVQTTAKRLALVSAIASTLCFAGVVWLATC